MGKYATGIGFFKSRDYEDKPCEWPGCQRDRPGFPPSRKYCDEHSKMASRLRRRPVAEARLEED